MERENVRLKAEVAKSEAELETSRREIEVQGKLSALPEQLATAARPTGPGEVSALTTDAIDEAGSPSRWSG